MKQQEDCSGLQKWDVGSQRSLIPYHHIYICVSSKSVNGALWSVLSLFGDPSFDLVQLHMHENEMECEDERKK